MKRLVLVLVLLLGGCGGGSPSGTPASSAPSASAAAPRPRFADLTQGNASSVVALHAHDATNRSAVVEPLIFMTGDAYCRTFKIKRTDSRCINHEYVTEESHTKVTVPIAPAAKYFTWETPDGTVCIEVPEKGGACPMTAGKFAAWARDNPGAMVAVTTENGTITRMAIIYTP